MSVLNATLKLTEFQALGIVMKRNLNANRPSVALKIEFVSEHRAFR